MFIFLSYGSNNSYDRKDIELIMMTIEQLKTDTTTAMPLVNRKKMAKSNSNQRFNLLIFLFHLISYSTYYNSEIIFHDKS